MNQVFLLTPVFLERHTQVLARVLCDDGHPVELVCYYEHDPAMLAGIQAAGVNVTLSTCGAGRACYNSCGCSSGWSGRPSSALFSSASLKRRSARDSVTAKVWSLGKDVRNWRHWALYTSVNGEAVAKQASSWATGRISMCFGPRRGPPGGGSAWARLGRPPALSRDLDGWGTSGSLHRGQSTGISLAVRGIRPADSRGNELPDSGDHFGSR